jgi:L-fucose mutarotase
MLKNIPREISPELMLMLMEMGHGDELVIADGNFPAESHARRIVRADGLAALPLFEAILQFLPIDRFVTESAIVMHPVDPEDPEPRIWAGFRMVLRNAEDREIPLTAVSREDFYERAREAYGIVATGETELYANIIIKKGVVMM